MSGDGVFLADVSNASPNTGPSESMAGVVERNIQALLERREAGERQRSGQQRVADAITRFTGSLLFVYIHLGIFGVWIVANLPGVPLPKFDPSFVVLAMFASVEAIFLSTFVLISQNRMAARAEQRADLGLQISLLAEHEVTRLITLVKAMAEAQGVEAARHEELPELERDVAPEKVLDAMEMHEHGAEGQAERMKDESQKVEGRRQRKAASHLLSGTVFTSTQFAPLFLKLRVCQCRTRRLWYGP